MPDDMNIVCDASLLYVMSVTWAHKMAHRPNGQTAMKLPTVHSISE